MALICADVPSRWPLPKTSGVLGTARLSVVGASVRRMGATTALLAYADGDVASVLKAAGEPTAEDTAALIARVFPGCRA